jgi:hypothetical protein
MKKPLLTSLALISTLHASEVIFSDAAEQAAQQRPTVMLNGTLTHCLSVSEVVQKMQRTVLTCLNFDLNDPQLDGLLSQRQTQANAGESFEGRLNQLYDNLTFIHKILLTTMRLLASDPTHPNLPDWMFLNESEDK